MLSHSITTTLFALASVRTILITECYVIDNHSSKNLRDRNTAKVFDMVPCRERYIEANADSVHGAH
jgi:hypothetical protein